MNKCIVGVILIILSVKNCICSNEIYEFYPCIDTYEVVETFSYSNPNSYNLTVMLPKFGNLTNRSYKFELKFDAYSNTTFYTIPKDFFDDSLSFEANMLFENETELTFKIAPYNGQKIPNLISVKINKEEVCNNGVYKDVWVNFINTKYKSIAQILPKKKTKNVDLVCGNKPVEHVPFIYQGSSSAPGNWPWHSAIYRLNTKKSSLVYICGGTLVSKTRVITAGHCVVEYGSVILQERLFVALGKFNFIGNDNGLQEKKVFEIILHPEYSPTLLANDIAILKLSSEVTFTDYVQPICLQTGNYPKKSKIVNLMGYVVGWGATETGKHSEQLLESRLPIKSDVECIKKDPSFFAIFLNEGSLCVGFVNGSNVCNGDSGGGLYLPQNTSDGKMIWYLRGITSLAASAQDHHTCNPNHYTIFTDIAYYDDFVKLHL